VPLLLPCRFEAWDLDTDGYINVEEFAFAGHAKIESPSTRELFKEIDSDSKHESSADCL
jgi:Ca2+-binding EF-hand superfamily protein